MTRLSRDEPARFVRANTKILSPPLVPEIALHLASEIVPLWQMTEQELDKTGLPPPYWAFAWAGGQALARHVLDNPRAVADKRVLDLGAGSGLCAIAAAKSGARHVTACDIDALACAAALLNAQVNDATIDVVAGDVIGDAVAADVVLVGDMCYEKPLAERLVVWLKGLAQAGKDILLGDPGRSYFPRESMREVARYAVRTTRELEDCELRSTGVFRFKG
jgi:predicted nicotinamide N-methyase